MLLLSEIGKGKAIIILTGLNKSILTRSLQQFKNIKDIRNFCVMSHGLRHL